VGSGQWAVGSGQWADGQKGENEKQNAVRKRQKADCKSAKAVGNDLLPTAHYVSVTLLSLTPEIASLLRRRRFVVC
jgi:hypothetical protein